MENPIELLNFSTKNRLPIVLQTEVTECGLACIAMIAQYYGHSVDINSLRMEYSISLKGATLKGLINLANKLHFSSRAIRITMPVINELKTPCILHWDLSHFVVLKKVTDKKIIIHDPAVGIKEYSHEEVADHFTGVVLELTPTKEFKKIESKKKARLSDLWGKIIGLKKTLLQIFFLSLILQLYSIISPFYMQMVVDEVIISQDMGLLKVLALGFAILLLLQLSIMGFRSLILLYMGNQLSIQMAANLLKHLLKLPMEYFEKRHIGDIVSRFGSLENIQQLLTTDIIETLVDGVMAIGLIIMMYIYSPLLGLIVTIAVFIYVIFRLIMYKPLRQRTEENIVANAKQNSNFMETVRGIQIVKLFGDEAQRQAIWQNYYADELNAGIRIGKLNISYAFINGLIFGLENIIVIYLAAINVVENVMTIGMLFAFISYKRQFTDKISNLVEKFVKFKMMSLYLQRIGDIVLSECEPDLEGTGLKEQVQGDVSLRNITFRYADDLPVILENLSCEIKAGSSVAIVGPSGCGKTTLMKIILGLLKPTAGQVLIDGNDINKVGLRSYRQQIGTVMQDDALFSGTIADNICFFDHDRDTDYIRKCAEMAAIHGDIIAMPMGYNSLIGDMGSSLSGGQKQRLLLARALYKKPKIILLDEATSHLDTMLETQINQTIKSLNITRIVIAHRLETIESSEKVLVLFNGVITENDTKEYMSFFKK